MQKKQWIIIFVVTIALFFLGKTGIFSGAFVGNLVSYFSPSLGKTVKEGLEYGDARLKGEGVVLLA